MLLARAMPERTIASSPMADSDPPAKRHRPLTATLSVEGLPHLQARLRRELAEILREAAADEPPAVAARLREIAGLFEAGLREVP